VLFCCTIKLVSNDRLKRYVILFWGLSVVLLVVLIATGTIARLSRMSLPSAFAAQQNLSGLESTSTPFQPGGNVTGVDNNLSLPTSTAIDGITPTPGIVVEQPFGGYATDTPPAQVRIYGVAPNSLPSDIDPLTGLRPDNPDLLDRRPIAIKITLFPRYSREWMSGLSMADVAYEYYIEDGLTRYVALFYGNNPDRVGGVRSGRYFDEHIMRMYHSYLVFANADERVENYLLDSDLLHFLVVSRPDNCPPMCRDKSIQDYNNFFFDAVYFQDWLAERGKDNSRQDLRPTLFSQLPPVPNDTATRIYTRYSSYSYNYWDYDPQTNKYLRFQETHDTLDGRSQEYAPLFDHLTNQQITADNVVMLYVQHRFANHFDEEDQVYHIDLLGSGKAYVFRDGVVYPANWWRVGMDQPLVLTDPAGNPLPLHTGQTFYEVIGDTSTSNQVGNEWYFQWKIP
jgi:hypothetical protein